MKITTELINTRIGPATVSLPELVAKVKIEPLQVTLHQKVLEFLRDFAIKCHKELFEDHMPEQIDMIIEEEKEQKIENVEMKPPEKMPAELKKDIFIQKASISQFYIKFNYRSYKLSMANLYHKDFLELLNIADIRDLVITCKKFEGRGFNNIEALTKNITEHYTNDIVNNQLMTCVTAVSPIRSVTNIMNGFADIFRLPVLSYRKRRRLWGGLTDGIGSFFSNVATETKIIGGTVFFWDFIRENRLLDLLLIVLVGNKLILINITKDYICIFNMQ